MAEKRSVVEATLETVDTEKRNTLRRMAKLAFVAPVVASFAMDGLTVSTARASDGVTSNNAG